MAECANNLVPAEYQNQDSFFGGSAPLSQGVGYAIVVGFGVFFSLFTTFLVYLDKRFSTSHKISSEEFNTAGRSIKTSLIASNIVSQWTWAATLLQSSNVAWQYGVSGPFWYAAGASIQVLLFGILAIELKRKAPKAHTFCEIILARWGKAAHQTFLFFGLMCNVIVMSMLLLGGAAVTTALTGMNINLACFLIPWGVIAYTVAGGLKAAFLAAYTHVVFLMLILLIFIFTIYMGPSEYIGSADVMYDKLTDVADATNCSYGPECQYTLTACGGVPKNRDGSYLTMLSTDGLIFGIINVVGNFGTVFLDQVYWQSAIAAKPEASATGYMLGGLAWFCIPFSLATSLGLGAVAMALPLTHAEANAGLVPAATAYHIMGDAGATLVLIVLFMAVTGAGAHEMIAVSSLVTYDIWRTYIKPTATGAELLSFSHRTVLVWGALSGLLAIILNEMGLSLGWVYVTMGTLIGGAVIPVSFVLTWSKATAKGAIIGSFSGLVCGIIAWMVACQAYYGKVDLDTLGGNYPALAGNLTSILVGGIVCAIISLANPDNFDYQATKNIRLVEEESSWFNSDYEEQKLAKAKNWILKWGIGGALLLVVGWPLLSIPAGVFSRSYFHFWVAISIVWGVVAAIFLIFCPVLESWDDCMRVCYGLCGSEYMPTGKKIAELEDRISALEGNPVKTVAVDGVDPVKSAIVA